MLPNLGKRSSKRLRRKPENSSPGPTRQSKTPSDKSKKVKPKRNKPDWPDTIDAMESLAFCYADKKEYGIANGAMLYDSHRMLPLFQLEIGKPGSSFAFEIAKKIGLPKEILDDAASKIVEDRVNFDKHLKEILQDKRYWEEKRKRIHDNKKRSIQLTD